MLEALVTNVEITTALNFLRKLMKRYGSPSEIVTGSLSAFVIPWGYLEMPREAFVFVHVLCAS